MDLTCDERPSDSPFVDCIWRSQSEHSPAPFISMAQTHCGIVVTKYKDRTFLTVRGPETRATPATGRSDAEFIGITFKAGVYLSSLPAKMTMDRRDVNLPEAAFNSFWLNGSTWQYPDFENADTFINCLERQELLVYDPLVAEMGKGQPLGMSTRTMQRRYLQATGMTHTALRQIERARYATNLLKKGLSILDTVFEAGYFDQPHLTRAMKYFVGLTPAQIIDQARSEKLSFLYKTKPFS